MLYIIGLGLTDEKDITLRGLEAVNKCDKVYLEAYTSLLSFGLSSDGFLNLEKLDGRPVILANREMVKERADEILVEASGSNVAFLIVGDRMARRIRTCQTWVLIIKKIKAAVPINDKQEEEEGGCNSGGGVTGAAKAEGGEGEGEESE